MHSGFLGFLRKQALLHRSRLVPSTAQSLRRRLAKTGVTPDKIEAHHISRIYRDMKGKWSAPDFDKIAHVVQALPRAKPLDAELTGVIIETRRHKNIRLVLESFLNAVDMPVQFFHGVDNEDYLKTELPTPIRERISFVKLPVGTFDANSYNALLLSEPFWTALAGRKKILVFQTDALVCENSCFDIREFLGFDYIGSLWRRKRRIGIVADGGNGGLSLRDWHRSVECLRRFPAAEWRGGEDGYFAFHLDLLGYRIAKPANCARFSTQEKFLYRSWGVHQPSLLKSADRDRFFAYCPEAHHLV